VTKKILVLNVIWMIIAALLVSITYVHTKESYTEVGRNNGLIEARWEAIDTLKKIKEIESCTLYEGQEQLAFIDVKTRSLAVIPTNDKTFHFCLYE
jgi:hypothetical protein